MRAVRVAVAVSAVSAICAAAGSSASAQVTPGVSWRISSLAQPTNFSTTQNEACSKNAEHCDSYVVLVRNVGSSSAPGPIRVTDHLPAGIEFVEALATREVSCEQLPENVVQCQTSEPVSQGFALGIRLYVRVGAEASKEPNGLLNSAEVTGAGASIATEARNSVSEALPSFGLEELELQAIDDNGEPESEAGGHPYAINSEIAFPTIFDATGFKVVPVEQPKNILAKMPPGVIANATAVPQCREAALVGGRSGGLEGESGCPPDAQIGTAIIQDNLDGRFNLKSSQYPESGLFPIYNLVPDVGYPAEFGFNYKGQTVVMYGAVVKDATGYRAALEVPGIIRGIGIGGFAVSFWGTPGDARHDVARQVENSRAGGAAAGAGSRAFLDNPTRCDKGADSAELTTNPWTAADTFVNQSAELFSSLTNCQALDFHPAISVVPEVGEADTPSGYEVVTTVPQGIDQAPATTPADVRAITLTMPKGVTISPPAADGLVGCAATGAQGINLGSSSVGPEGQDLGDPLATELGAGHPGGNGSSYDDGLYHLAAGHCPSASILGTVEVETPVLPPHTLLGRLYLAEPGCSPCGERETEDGTAFRAYLEVAGAGVVVKLAGRVEVGGQGEHSRLTGLAPGQVRTTFENLPQFPFARVAIKLSGGPRAPLANPQACGSRSATALIQPWTTEGAPSTELSSAFSIGGNGQGAPCGTAQTFAPPVSGGATSTVAKGETSFSFTIARRAGEADLASLAVTTPPGLLGDISKVARCDAASAAAGSCPESSRIGTATAAVGSGPHPYWQSGPVYLTSAYEGAPFGLEIAVPAKAGPFNLGTIITRARILVDPHTAALTVASDRLPDSVDGIPLRIAEINVTIDRPNFVKNPTNCRALSISSMVTGAGEDGSAPTASASIPFAVHGCSSLPFKPTISFSMPASFSRANGAALRVRVTSNASQANIGSVKVNLPKQLPSRLSTLQHACPHQTFEANPASCPSQSLVGSVVAITPILHEPLRGPAYLVSYAGEKLPNLVFVLQGEGVVLNLSGSTQIKHGITSEAFHTVPDAPITSFEANFPKGPHSALAAFGRICHERLAAPYLFEGQNGARLKATGTVKVLGCPRAHKKKAKKKK